jgi:hypothetical protein
VKGEMTGDGRKDMNRQEHDVPRGKPAQFAGRWRACASRRPGGRVARRVALLVPILAAVGAIAAGCFGTRFYDSGDNHPPNTIFLDNGIYTTPHPGALVRTEPVSLYWRGTDVVDGDAMAYYMYRVSPPDTGWVRTTATHLTLSGLRDTTYTVCVYAVDARGAADPDPTCRTFSANVVHPGHVVLAGDLNERTHEFAWNWQISDDSEFTDDQYTWEMQLVEYYTYPGTSIDSLLHDFGRGPVDPPGAHEFRIMPASHHKYCLTIYASLPDTLPQPEPQRSCYLAP